MARRLVGWWDFVLLFSLLALAILGCRFDLFEDINAKLDNAGGVVGDGGVGLLVMVMVVFS